MALSPLQREQQQQRIEDCRELYLKHGGDDHEAIESEMRALGHRDFHRRSLYRRFERGTSQAGWIERFGWNSLLRNAECGVRIQGDEAASANPTPEIIRHEKTEHFISSTTPRSAIRDPQLLDFDDFVAWLKRVSPGMQWEFKHQVYVYKYLKRVYDGDLKRLMIFMPPRHGKSELVTKHFAAYWLKKNPSKNIILGCYSQQLANKFSRGIKGVYLQDKFLESEALQRSEIENGKWRIDNERHSEDGTATTARSRITDAPGCTLSSNSQLSTINSQLAFRPRNAEAEWEMPEGGGVRAVGVGAGITGYGASLIIIDDPTKSRAQAESETYRERVWDWFNDDLTTRLEPEGAMILIQTRWHEDDLAGRLLKQMKEEGGEYWEVVNLPALAEGEEGEKMRKWESETEPVTTGSSPSHSLTGSLSHGLLRDPLNRQPGDALWPERFDAPALEKLKRQLGSYSFAALYQQKPVPAEGGLFKRAWFRTVPHLPPNVKKKRGWDLAISRNTDADHTASAGVAYDDTGNMYIYDVIRRRIEYPEQRKLILGRILSETDTEHGIELSANGNAVIQDLRRERIVQGRTLRGVKPTGDKITRALPWIALAEEGRVFLVRGQWNDEFIDEACSFPLGTHDDQIDAVSIAVELHRKQKHIAMGC